MSSSSSRGSVSEVQLSAGSSLTTKTQHVSNQWRNYKHILIMTLCMYELMIPAFPAKCSMQGTTAWFFSLTTIRYIIMTEVAKEFVKTSLQLAKWLPISIHDNVNYSTSLTMVCALNSLTEVLCPPASGCSGGDSSWNTQARAGWVSCWDLHWGWGGSRLRWWTTTTTTSSSKVLSPRLLRQKWEEYRCTAFTHSNICALMVVKYSVF